MAEIVMLPKPGKDKKFPQNYRPISLLSAISKIAEKIVLNKLKEEIEEREMLPKEQFGFRGRHSAEEQLLLITEIAMQGTTRMKTTMWMAKLTKSFLHERTVKVNRGDHTSEERELEAGVPQGAAPL